LYVIPERLPVVIKIEMHVIPERLLAQSYPGSQLLITLLYLIAINNNRTVTLGEILNPVSTGYRFSMTILLLDLLLAPDASRFRDNVILIVKT
jgi:hypothetical protein